MALQALRWSRSHEALREWRRTCKGDGYQSLNPKGHLWVFNWHALLVGTEVHIVDKYNEGARAKKDPFGKKVTFYVSLT